MKESGDVGDSLATRGEHDIIGVYGRVRGLESRAQAEPDCVVVLMMCFLVLDMR